MPKPRRYRPKEPRPERAFTGSKPKPGPLSKGMGMGLKLPSKVAMALSNISKNIRSGMMKRV